MVLLGEGFGRIIIKVFFYFGDMGKMWSFGMGQDGRAKLGVVFGIEG